MSIINIEDLDKQAIANSDEKERKRKAKVAQINQQAAARQREVKEREDLQRDETLKRLMNEVKSQYLFINTWASEKDFEASWKDDKERLIRNHQTTLNVPRM